MKGFESLEDVKALVVLEELKKKLFAKLELSIHLSKGFYYFRNVSVVSGFAVEKLVLQNIYRSRILQIP